MKAALIAGADVPGLKEAIDRAADCYRTTQFDAERGMFAYSTARDKPVAKGTASCTAIGALALQITGYGATPEVQAAVQTLSDKTCVWGEPGGLGGHTLYIWYYLTQVKYHAGESIFKQWNNLFARTLLSAQNNDGSWTPFAEAEKRLGPVYGTTFCALTLMVYYRVLPTYQPIEVTEPPTPSSGDDVTVEII